MASHNTPIRLLKKFLSLSGQNIDLITAEKLLISHPSYPSLEAFTEVMEYFGIPNEAFLTDYESLLEMKVPLLLHLDIHEGRFILLLSIDKQSARIYIPESDRIMDIPREALLKQWSGVVFRIEKRHKRLSDLFTLRYLLLSVAILCSLSGILWFIFLSFSTPLWIYAAGINLIGAITSLCIVYHETGVYYPLSRQICHLTENTDCEAVLSSPASKIAGIISLGDIGLIYFSGSLLVLLLLPLSDNPQSHINLLLYISVCTLPYTLFSIYYQKFKVKKWCPFCLLSLFMIWSSFICYYYLFVPHSYKSASFYLFTIAFGIVFCVWFIFRSRLTSTRKQFHAEVEVLKMKRNPAILSLLLDTQPAFQMAFDKDDIQWGSASSSVRITTLISEECTHCRKVVKDMLDCIQKHTTQIDWIIRFGYQDFDPDRDRFSSHFYYLYYHHKEYFLPALQDWANQMNYHTWIKKYQLSQENTHQAFPESKKQWIISNQFSKTPMIFLENKELPDEYRVIDLGFLLMNEDIISVIKA